MRKSKAAVLVLIFLALFGIKSFFPEQTARFLDSAGSLLRGEISYAQVFSRLGESIAVFSRSTPTAAPVQAAQPETALLTERASNLGERCTLSAQPAQTQVPEAVSAFLASQAEFADYELPENVSYDYSPFPESCTSPVAGYNSSGFGYRVHPIHGDVRFHYGTDFAAWTGESILAFADGTVSFAGYCDSYGYYVTIEHANGWESLYAHCSELKVTTGQSVSAGELIALVGASGLATGPHLHFELSCGGVYTNPEYYVG